MGTNEILLDVEGVNDIIWCVPFFNLPPIICHQKWDIILCSFFKIHILISSILTDFKNKKLELLESSFLKNKGPKSHLKIKTNFQKLNLGYITSSPSGKERQFSPDYLGFEPWTHNLFRRVRAPFQREWVVFGGGPEILIWGVQT